MNKHGGYQGSAKEMVDFSVNINPLGIPKNLEKKLIAGISGLVSYPEITGQSARLKLSKDLKIKPDHLILGNGAIELIYLLARSLEPGKALIIQPTFNEYERALAMYGWEVNHLILEKDDGFLIQSERLQASLQELRPDLVFICNPNNPTGTLYSPDQIKAWMALADWDLTWFLDESFMDFTGQVGMEAETNKNIFILKSLTKFYALPGLRIGYGIGPPDMIKKMMHYKEPWTINGLALIALKEVYEEEAFARQSRAFIKEQGLKVYGELLKIPDLEVFKSHTDFHLCRLLTGSSLDLKEDLEKEGMSLRTCEDFLGLDETYFRIAIKNEEDNDKLVTFLKKWKG